VLLHTYLPLQQRGRRAITTLNTFTVQKRSHKKIFSPATLFIAYSGNLLYICPTFLLKRKRHVCKDVAFSKKSIVQLSDEVFQDRNQKVLFIGNGSEPSNSTNIQVRLFSAKIFCVVWCVSVPRLSLNPCICALPRRPTALFFL
jgi:hypothetical protein